MSDTVEFDNTQASTEGWGIFDCDGSDNGPWQIQADDEADIFADDNDAWFFVARKAREFSEYHLSALRFLKEHNPMELESFRKFTSFKMEV